MKVRALRFIGSFVDVRDLEPGQIYDVSDVKAGQLIANGLAEAVDTDHPAELEAAALKSARRRG